MATGRELAEKNILKSCLIGLATVARHAAQYEQAQAFLAESMRYAEGRDRPLRATRVQHELAYVAALQGDDAQAFALYRSCIVKWQEFGRLLWVASALQGFALQAFRKAQPERALCLGGAAVALRQAYGPVLGFDADLFWSPAEQAQWQQIMDAARMQLGEVCARRVWDEGQAMAVEGAVRYAVGEDRSTVHS